MIFGTRKVESLGYRMVKKIAEKFNRMSRVQQTTDRQQTDGIATASSDREREFTFAKNVSNIGLINTLITLASRKSALSICLMFR